MIKSIFLILIIINISILAFFSFTDEGLPHNRVERVITQINPSVIKIINEGIIEEDRKNDILYTSNDISTCIEANLANEAEVLFMQKELQNTLNNVQTKIISTAQNGSYIVYAASSKNIKTQMADYRRLKITPISTATVDNNKIVAFGVFTNKPSAIEYLDMLKPKGAKNLQIKLLQDTSLNIFWLRLPYASIEEEGLIRKISAKYGIMTRYCQ